MALQAKTLRTMSDEQLRVTLKDLEQHLFKLRVQAATDRLRAPAEVRKTKRDIARVLMVMHERELAKQQQLPPEQLQQQLATLEQIISQDQPGKRRAYRQARRIRQWLGNRNVNVKG